MPIYEYRCTECNEEFSLLQSIHSAENDTKCPKCFSGKVKKVVSAFSYASDSEGGLSSPMPSSGFGVGGG